MSPLASALLVIAVSFAGAAVWRETHSIFLQLYYHFIRREMLTFWFRSIPLGTLLYDGFVLLAWSLLYYGINDWIELESQRLHIARAESSAHSARLRALQSQLEPHFLFNTLNAISTLVSEGKNADANRMIARLSDFLRLSLETADTPEISVAQELEFVRRYLEIEQIRFADRLQVKIDAQPEALSALRPRPGAPTFGRERRQTRCAASRKRRLSSSGDPCLRWKASSHCHRRRRWPCAC
jgi:hypothetical protein